MPISGKRTALPVAADRQKVWLFAGSVAGEGTSLSIMNLAIAAQRLGIRTLIVEGHTRSPRISNVFRLELEPGLTGCLNRSLNAGQAIQKSSLAGRGCSAGGPRGALSGNLVGHSRLSSPAG